MARRSPTNEIRFTRVYDAPVRAVWDAWTIPEQVEQWWGPRGFTLTTHAKDLRSGGSWRYTMHGPDGVDYPNVTKYLAVEPLQRLHYDHGGTDDTPPLFRVDARFQDVGGKTRMDLVFTFDSVQAALETEKFIRRAGGYSTWDRLAEHLAAGAGREATFVVQRMFDAPIEKVFAAWTTPAQLATWLPPAGTTMRFVRDTLAVGRSTLFALEGEHGATYVRAEYLAIEPTSRLVYDQQFVDADERPAPAPGAEAWPATLRNTVLFTALGPDQTLVALHTEPHGPASPAELEAFEKERGGMTAGWNGSFDVLDGVMEG